MQPQHPSSIQPSTKLSLGKAFPSGSHSAFKLKPEGTSQGAHPITILASVHTETFELEFCATHARLSLLGLQTLRSFDAVYAALRESQHYSDGLDLLWDLSNADVFALSDWDWALLTSRLARAPVAKRRSRMAWIVPALTDVAIEGKIRKLMAKLKQVDWRFSSDLAHATQWIVSPVQNQQ